MAAKFKKGDRVVVIAGRDKGVTGDITQVLVKAGRVSVQGVGKVKRHRRPTADSTGGIFEEERPVAISNVAHVDPKTGKPTRVGFKIDDDGKKVRYYKSSKEVLP